MEQFQVFVTLGVSRKKRLQKNYQSPKNLPKWELGTNSPTEIKSKWNFKLPETHKAFHGIQILCRIFWCVNDLVTWRFYSRPCF